MPGEQTRYDQIIERVFFAHYEPGSREFPFTAKELRTAAQELEIEVPSNPPDVLYTYRMGREQFPDSIRATAPDLEWTIALAGRGKYRFILVREAQIRPNRMLPTIKIPDSTPGVIKKYALSDEQALLAKVRYNRLIDVFTGIVCYSLQNHLRTSVEKMGQVEVDELYAGVDRSGAHYILPVQAKGGSDILAVVQVLQDLALCSQKFPHLVCRAIAAQFMADDVIALFELRGEDGDVLLTDEKHYQLVPEDQLSAEDLAEYRRRSTSPE